MPDIHRFLNSKFFFFIFTNDHNGRFFFCLKSTRMLLYIAFYQLPLILIAVVQCFLINVVYLMACAFISHDDVALFE